MYYELNAPVAVEAGPWLLRERRRPSMKRRDFYAEVEERGSLHPVTAEAERRVRRSSAGRERFRRMLALSKRLASSSLPEVTRRTWLDLEEQLHAHWLAIAVEHYNLGMAAGLRRAAADTGAPSELPPRDRLRALADALREAIELL